MTLKTSQIACLDTIVKHETSHTYFVLRLCLENNCNRAKAMANTSTVLHHLLCYLCNSMEEYHLIHNALKEQFF